MKDIRLTAKGLCKADIRDIQCCRAIPLQDVALPLCANGFAEAIHNRWLTGGTDGWGFIELALLSRQTANIPQAPVTNTLYYNPNIQLLVNFYLQKAASALQTPYRQKQPERLLASTQMGTTSATKSTAAPSLQAASMDKTAPLQKAEQSQKADKLQRVGKTTSKTSDAPEKKNVPASFARKAEIPASGEKNSTQNAPARTARILPPALSAQYHRLAVNTQIPAAAALGDVPAAIPSKPLPSSLTLLTALLRRQVGGNSSPLHRLALLQNPPAQFTPVLLMQLQKSAEQRGMNTAARTFKPIEANGFALTAGFSPIKDSERIHRGILGTAIPSSTAGSWMYADTEQAKAEFAAPGINRQGSWSGRAAAELTLLRILTGAAPSVARETSPFAGTDSVALTKALQLLSQVHPSQILRQPNVPGLSTPAAKGDFHPAQRRVNGSSPVSLKNSGTKNAVFAAQTALLGYQQPVISPVGVNGQISGNGFSKNNSALSLGSSITGWGNVSADLLSPAAQILQRYATFSGAKSAVLYRLTAQSLIRSEQPSSARYLLHRLKTEQPGFQPNSSAPALPVTSTRIPAKFSADISKEIPGKFLSAQQEGIKDAMPASGFLNLAPLVAEITQAIQTSMQKAVDIVHRQPHSVSGSDSSNTAFAAAEPANVPVSALVSRKGRILPTGKADTAVPASSAPHETGILIFGNTFSYAESGFPTVKIPSAQIPSSQMLTGSSFVQSKPILTTSISSLRQPMLQTGAFTGKVSAPATTEKDNVILSRTAPSFAQPPLQAKNNLQTVLPDSRALPTLQSATGKSAILRHTDTPALILSKQAEHSQTPPLGSVMTQALQPVMPMQTVQRPNKAEFPLRTNDTGKMTESVTTKQIAKSAALLNKAHTSTAAESGERSLSGKRIATKQLSSLLESGLAQKEPMSPSANLSAGHKPISLIKSPPTQAFSSLLFEKRIIGGNQRAAGGKASAPVQRLAGSTEPSQMNRTARFSTVPPVTENLHATIGRNAAAITSALESTYAVAAVLPGVKKTSAAAIPLVMTVPLSPAGVYGQETRSAAVKPSLQSSGIVSSLQLPQARNASPAQMVMLAPTAAKQYNATAAPSGSMAGIPAQMVHPTFPAEQAQKQLLSGMTHTSQQTSQQMTLQGGQSSQIRVNANAQGIFDTLRPNEINALAEKVYARLESMLKREKRCLGL